MFLVRKRTGGDTGKLFAMKVLEKASIVQKRRTTEHTKTERQVLEMIRHSPFLVSNTIPPDLHLIFLSLFLCIYASLFLTYVSECKYLVHNLSVRNKVYQRSKMTIWNNSVHLFLDHDALCLPNPIQTPHCPGLCQRRRTFHTLMSEGKIHRKRSQNLHCWNCSLPGTIAQGKQTHIPLNFRSNLLISFTFAFLLKCSPSVICRVFNLTLLGNDFDLVQINQIFYLLTLFSIDTWCQC